ncbi:MAG: gliding motility lipoprotein GldH [Flavobacteriales bacterium]|nr:gliding motility lipoprotein GldH [Flavobacteriales bacterium]
MTQLFGTINITIPHEGTNSLFRPISYLLFSIAMLFSACTQKPFYERMDAMPDHVWASTEKCVHEVTVTDTLQTFDFYLNIRIGADYEFSNMYLFIGTEFPDGRALRDTVECILADRTGRWLGTGLGDMRDNRILFKPNVRFPHVGTYRFDLEQGMRMEHLEHVYDVGISIVPNGGKRG